MIRTVGGRFRRLGGKIKLARGRIECVCVEYFCGNWIEGIARHGGIERMDIEERERSN